MSPDPHRHTVTAIVVAHDGSRWLPETLEALRSQTRPPDHVVAVDNDSRDRSGTLLMEEFGADHVLKLPRDTSFGAAVGKAIQHPGAGAPTSALAGVGGGGAQWLWVLHDDCAPAPDALERLLGTADENRYAAMLGPKLRDWLDRRVLLEAGITIDGSGRRETGLEQREFDQGQHDGVHEVLAVSTAGMLIRRDVLDALGGFAPELPLFRDDVDLGWRVNASGHRVLAVTSAVAYHAEAASRRRRRVSVAVEHPRLLDRRSALFVLFANLPRKHAVWAGVRNLFGGLLRTLVFLLAKQPGHAWDEVRAYASLAGAPAGVWRARRRRSRGPRRSYRTLRKLMPPRGHGFRRFADMVREFVSSSGPVEAGRHADTGSIAEDEEPLAPREGLIQRLAREPGVVLCAALTVIALVAERGLLGGGRLGGGALLPVSGGAGDLWGQYLSGWQAIGLGSDVPSPPYVAVIALLATLLLGKTWLAIDLLLLGAVPLAGASAYLASRWVVADVRIRLWAAASYALLPVATGAVASGRFGTAAVFVLLPLIGVLVARMLRLGHRKATRAAWGAGGLLAVAAAFVPLAWLLAAIVGTVAYRLRGEAHRSQRGLRTRLAIVLLVPPVLLLPWTPRLLLHPGLFLREAGLPAPDLAAAPEALSVLSLQPGGPGMPPVWVATGLLAAGAVAFLRRDRRVIIAIGWALALLGMAAGVVVSRLAAAPPSEGSAAAGWPGVCMALAGAGVILAAAVGAERALAAWRGDAPGPSAQAGEDTEVSAVTTVGTGAEGSEDSLGPPGGEGAVRSRTRRTLPALGRLPGLGSRTGSSSLSRLAGLAIPRRQRPGRTGAAGLPVGGSRLRGARRKPWVAAGFGVLACSTPVAAAAVWLYTGAAGPLDNTNPPVLPAFVAAQSEGPAHLRTLVLRGVDDGEVSYTVLRDRAPLLGSPKIPAPPGVTDRVTSVVAGLASGRRSGEVSELTSHGIQFVVMSGPVDPGLARSLDTNPGLSRVSRLPDLAVWRLDGDGTRLRVVSESGSQQLPSGKVGARTEVPEGSGERTLVLAESADSGWHATLDGRELQPTTVRGWAQGFELPSSGGALEIGHSSPRGLWVLLEALLAFAVFILALPGGGTGTEEAEPEPRRERGRARRAPRRARGHRATKAEKARASAAAAEQPDRGGRRRSR